MASNLVSIPSGWQKVAISNCVTERRKSPIKVDDAANYGPYPFFTSGEGVLQHNEALIDGETLFLATGGVANVKFFDGKAAYSTDTYALGAKDGYDTRFLYYLLLFLRDYINTNFFQGSGLKHLKKKDLKSFEIAVPSSKDEQKRISDTLFELDEAIAQTDALIAKYESIKKGLMADLLTNGIDTAGNIRSGATHKYKDSPIGRIPVEWECVEMSSLMTAIDAQPDHRTPPDVEDGVPYAGISDVDEHGHLLAEKCRRVGNNVLEKQKGIFTVEDGDIIFGKIGTIGQPKRLPVLKDGYAVSANVIVIKPKDNALFLYYSLKSDYVEKEVDLSIHSTSQPAFGMGKIRELLIKRPLRDEQGIIADIIKGIDDVVLEYTMESRKLSSISKGLLNDLITGKVRV